MNRRALALGAAVIALAAANAWQWWPREARPALAQHAAGRAAVQPEDFDLKASPAPAAVGVTRDLFSPKAPIPASARNAVPRALAPNDKAKVREPATQGKAQQPAKTAMQLAEEAARAEAGALKVVGVVFRGGRGEAYIVRGEQMDIARVGGKVGGRFVVTSIGRESVSLRDTATRLVQDIPVLGK